MSKQIRRYLNIQKEKMVGIVDLDLDLNFHFTANEIKDFKNLRIRILYQHLRHEQIAANLTFMQMNKKNINENLLFNFNLQKTIKLIGFTEQQILSAIKKLVKLGLISCIWKEKNDLTDLKLLLLRRQ